MGTELTKSASGPVGAQLTVWQLSVHKAWYDSEHTSLHLTADGAKAADLGPDWAEESGGSAQPAWNWVPEMTVSFATDGSQWQPVPGYWACQRGAVRATVSQRPVGP